MRKARTGVTNAAMALAVFVAAAMLAGCGKKETAALPPPEVLVMEAATRDVPVYREWIGTIDGSENAEIRARVTGYLVKHDYEKGSLVKKDTLLFEIDPRPFQAELAQAKSQI
jgi:membrane fusion protein, multidrug efflux system